VQNKHEHAPIDIAPS